MPNWVTNTLQFETREVAEKIWNKYTSAVEEDGVKCLNFDFNKIIKQPEELDIVCGSETDMGILLYLNTLCPQNREKYIAMLKNDTTLYPFGFPLDWASTKANEAKGARKKELLKLGREAISNLKKYGAVTWYDWRLDHWGVKWDACDSYLTDDGDIVFNTPWDTPKLILKRLADIENVHFINKADYEGYDTPVKEGY